MHKQGVHAFDLEQVGLLAYSGLGKGICLRHSVDHLELGLAFIGGHILARVNYAHVQSVKAFTFFHQFPLFLDLEQAIYHRLNKLPL